MTKNRSDCIKLIAIITMLIDHTGAILFPDLTLLRVIGRVAFPLFAFQLGIGYSHTKSFAKYVTRIFVFGAAVQLLYAASISLFAIDGSPLDFNIFFTLTLGLLSIRLFDAGKYIHLIPVFAIPLMAGYYGVNLDYGVYGIAMILILFMTKDHPLRLTAAFLALNLAYSLLTHNLLQSACVIALAFILRPPELKIPIPGCVFYLFYPVHLAALHAISKLP